MTITKAAKHTKVPVRQLQRNASEWINRAREGEQIDITNHGTLVAHLIPPDPEEEVWQQLIDRGLVDPTDDRRGGLSGWRSPITEPIDPPLSQVIIQMREEETR
ncbi:MAG: type II toxin-antitoxin system Phd/YefM family antitoxin [Mycobacteriales bacterium]